MKTYIVYVQKKHSRIECIEVDAYSPHDAKRIVRNKLGKETFNFVKVVEK